MFSGGLANGHPDGNKAKAPGRPKRKGPAKGPQGENARRAQGPRPAKKADSRTRAGAEAKPAQKKTGQNGREACRERVCTYVEISVVDDYLQKNKRHKEE